MGVDRSPRHRRLTLFHTLGIDASAILTLVKPETIARIGRVWFVQREVTPNVPVKPLPTGHYGFGHIIDTLACSAQSVWWNSMVTRPEMGRFGVKLEGSGKRRVFAIANPLYQALVRPLHDWVMEILRRLPTDGTFNQTAPPARLRGKFDGFSFDLKAATDSLPVSVSAGVLACLVGSWPRPGRTSCVVPVSGPPIRRENRRAPSCFASQRVSL